MRKSNPKQWHRELKKLTRFDQHQEDLVVVESIKDFDDDEQAEIFAHKFAEVSQEYDKLKKEDIEIPDFSDDDFPVITEVDVKNILDEIDTSKANVHGDIPAKIVKHFSEQLAFPVSNVINSSIRQGVWPSILKLELVTPVPKVFPPKTVDQLRNISVLLNLNNVIEKIISKMMISNMKHKIDPAQFANQKGLSIQHYLVKMIDKISQSVDTNSKSVAVLATLVINVLNWELSHSYKME